MEYDIKHKWFLKYHFFIWYDYCGKFSCSWTSEGWHGIDVIFAGRDSSEIYPVRTAIRVWLSLCASFWMVPSYKGKQTLWTVVVSVGLLFTASVHLGDAVFLGLLWGPCVPSSSSSSSSSFPPACINMLHVCVCICIICVYVSIERLPIFYVMGVLSAYTSVHHLHA